MKVTNLENGRTVHVTINDRGPYVRGRVIDLTPKAADALAMRKDGVVKVEVRPETVPETVEPAPIQEAGVDVPAMPLSRN